MEFSRLFPEVPEDLSALGDESLNDLLRDFAAVSEQLRDGTLDLSEAFGAEVAPETATAEMMRQWAEARDTVLAIRGVLQEREAGRANFTEEAESLHEAFAEAAAVPAEVEDTAAAEPEALAAESDDDGTVTSRRP